jgi:hypothetical protein
VHSKDTAAHSDVRVSHLGEAALRYARFGIPVFPLRPGTKVPATRNGVLDACTDARQVRAWWQRANYNIGLACGAVFDVLDVDVKHVDGLESERQLAAAGLLRGVWGRAITPSGGRHLLLPLSGDGNHTCARYGLDHRGRGGYIVAAPSITEAGRYRWEAVELGRRGRQVFDWEAAMRALGKPAPAPRPYSRPASGDGAGLVGFVQASQPGERNARLYWAARRAVDDGLDPEILREAALAVGLGDFEITGTLASAARTAAA